MWNVYDWKCSCLLSCMCSKCLTTSSVQSQDLKKKLICLFTPSLAFLWLLSVQYSTSSFILSETLRCLCRMFCHVTLTTGVVTFPLWLEGLRTG